MITSKDQNKGFRIYLTPQRAYSKEAFVYEKNVGF